MRVCSEPCAHVQPCDDEGARDCAVGQAEGHSDDVVAVRLKSLHARRRARDARDAVDNRWRGAGSEVERRDASGEG